MAIPTISGYALERFGLGRTDPGTQGFDVAFQPLEEIGASQDTIQESELNRMEMTFQ